MKALVSGVTGQDGSYLSELLLSKGYEVHGIRRRSSSFNTGRIDHLIHNPCFRLHYADICDPLSVERVMTLAEPDEIYNLAAQSHVGLSFDLPNYTAEATGQGALNVLEAMRHVAPQARFYQASSSEMFGNAPAPQSERTPFAPCSPYACAKTHAHHMAVMYREAYGLHISCGILFNHESPRRGETFVTRKITMAVARIKAGLQKRLTLGDMESRRDWGYAPEYVNAMWMMLQRDQPDDYVIGTGECVSVAHFADMAFAAAGLVWEKYTDTDARCFRPAEVFELAADISRAKCRLGWEPIVCVKELARIMVEADMKALQCGI